LSEVVECLISAFAKVVMISLSLLMACLADC